MKYILPFFLSLLFLQAAAQQSISLETGTTRFKTGDDIAWSKPDFNDKDWQLISTNKTWESQGYEKYDGFAWYRFHFTLPSSLKATAWWPDTLRLFLGRIDDADEVFLNGGSISKTGSFPSDPGGYDTRWNVNRVIRLASGNPLVKWDAENVLAVKVYDGGGAGGMFAGTPMVSLLSLEDAVQFTAGNANGNWKLELKNRTGKKLDGTITIDVLKTGSTKPVQHTVSPVSLGAQQSYSSPLTLAVQERHEIVAVFKEKQSGMSVRFSEAPPYILTPKPAATPRINNARVFGIRPGSPFLFKIAATGDKPLQYAVNKLPAGLRLDPATGIITGVLVQPGEYKMQFVVSNAKGKAVQDFTVTCGSLLALTPPMGWNSWNCWGLSVSAEKVKASAQALLDKGLADHGWTYMNIDDGWEASSRNEKGEMVTNQKFPDMKALGDWLHSKGLKFGIYSSPGTHTCGGYLGSYQHELQDAVSYNSWGIDYLKYDWCSYGNIHDEKDSTVASYKKPYEVMQSALRSQPRDIVYSLCQYGMKDVWKWGAEVDGNCWRTTGDIEDSWESMYAIAFNQVPMQPYAQPGRWNDPDMLIVGNVGWGENLHPTRLSADEQYTHISLWSLLASPLLIGCDIASIDAFTLNLLSNDEVIAVNQDPAGKQAKRVIRNEQYQVWVKELQDGSKAIGIFNVSGSNENVTVNFSELGLTGSFKIRDLWRQKEMGAGTEFTGMVPSHGVMLVKIRP